MRTRQSKPAGAITLTIALCRRICDYANSPSDLSVRQARAALESAGDCFESARND